MCAICVQCVLDCVHSFVCVCVCMCVYVYVCMCVCVYVCVYVCMCECVVCVCMCVCVQTFSCVPSGDRELTWAIRVVTDRWKVPGSCPHNALMGYRSISKSTQHTD